jgi:hypothetical protein
MISTCGEFGIAVPAKVSGSENLRIGMRTVYDGA